LNEQANNKKPSEDIIGGIHLLNRLLPPIMESSSEISQRFFWSEENATTRGELLCSLLITLFFKEGFTINSNKEGNIIE